MKKKLFITLLAIIATFTCALAFAACGGGTNGVYYKLNYNGTLDESVYYKLNSGNWEDDDGVKGTYKTDGNKIRLYVELFGEKEALADGTVENGVLSIDMGAGMKEIYITKDHKHVYGEWKTVSVADCTTDGLKTRTCACGVTDRDETPRLGHSGEWTVTKQATCTEEGSKKIHCTVCDEDDTEIIEKLPHSLNTLYSYNTDNHWKYCELCGNKANIEEHTGNSECDVCGIPLADTAGLELTLNSDGTGYEVTGIGSATEKFIRIPQTHEGLPVISIGDNAFRRCSITGVMIPDSVTSIGNFVFEECYSLTSITIPDSVTSVGDFAFEECDLLTSITIPNSVTSIGRSAFRGCSSLTSVTIPDSVTTIGEGAFSGCSSLTSIAIGKGVTTIGESAFYECRSLTSINIPNSVTYIGNEAFKDCDNIIQTENGVQYVGKWVIGYDKPLTQVTLRSDTRGIAVYAFRQCSTLTSITIPDSVTYINDCAFQLCAKLESIKIPDSVTYIGIGAFADLTSLESINIGNGVTAIGEATFRDCSLLKSVTIGKNVTTIGYCAFISCTSLESITIGNGVTEIGDSAFYKCRSLTSIIIPDSVTYIGIDTFDFCSSLESITFKDTVAKWNASEKGISWNTYTGDYTIYCTDGEIAKDGTVTMY